MWLAGGRLPGVLLVLCTAFAFPVVGFADWRDFAPQPFENGAYLDLFSSWERDHLSPGGAPTTRWTDTFIRERLTLFSNGYSYHPRFLQYRFSIGGAVKQEDYESTVPVPTGWTDGTGLDYDTKLVFLPEHSYNLEVFARRFQPVFKEESAIQHNSVENSRGVSFRYRKKPYFFHTGYVDDQIDSAGVSSDVSRFSVDGQYFKRSASGNEVSFSGAFIPSWFSNSEGLSGNATQYLVGNYLNVDPATFDLPTTLGYAGRPLHYLQEALLRVQLNSGFSYNTFTQQGSTSGNFENNQLAWYETLNVYLPWNLRGDALWRYQDNNATISGEGTSAPAELSNIERTVQAELVHKLYESVDTTYTFRYDDQSSSTGDTKSTSNSGAINYVKSIPWGRFLAGGSVARIDTESTGAVEVLNEPHLGVLVQPPGRFTLDQQNVLASSIVVVLQSPLPPFQLIPLVQGVNYDVVAVPNTFEIVVLSLPPQFAVPGTYDFLVSYSLLSGQFTLQTDSFAGNTSVQLFDDLLTPYFNYLRITSSVVSGVFPGVPLDATTYTAGVAYHNGPLRARGEYQQLDWNVTPYRAWRGEVQYVGAVNESTSVYATAGYQNKYYPKGTAAYFPGQIATTFSQPFTEQSETITGNVQKQFFSRNMTLSLGGSYSRLQGLIDSNAYSVTSAWTWMIGKVDLTAGATAYGSDTSGTNTIPGERDHQYVYLNFRRRLF